MSSPIHSPKIKVFYQTKLQPAPRQHQAWRRFLLPAVLSLTLIVGGTGGAYLGWYSRPGQAESVAPVQQPAVNAIPLQFDQSELNVVAEILPILIEENRHDPTPEEIKAAQRKDGLKKYLAAQKSPLARDDGALDALLRARNMKLILAISFVESNFCKKSVAHNCSGIGGSDLKHYPGYAAWINDFDNLLEKRYKGLPVEKFIGYYVQPGSQNWVDGVYQVLAELNHRHIE